MDKKAFRYRLLCFFIIVFCGLSPLKSQNSIMAVAPPNDFRFEDLWNVNIVLNNSIKYPDYYINLRIFNGNSGLLMDVVSNKFQAQSNSLSFSAVDLSMIKPFSYPYKSSAVLGDIVTRGGLFPAGDYRFDYTLYGVDAVGANTKLTTTTVSHSVIMPAALQLVSVFDKDTVKEVSPIFMWLPASATQTVGGVESAKEYKLTYTVSVVEVLKNQTPYAAITSNPQFFYQTGLENTLLQYPFSARKFDECKTYAWQVKGIINGQTVIASEVWTFNTPCETPVISPDAPVLVKKKEDLAVCYVKNNTVYFAYYEEYHVEEGAQLNAVIYNSKQEVVNTSDQLNLTVQKGYNTFTLNSCPKDANLLNGEKYLLVITNAKNEKWYLRIVNNQTTNNCY